MADNAIARANMMMRTLPTSGAGILANQEVVANGTNKVDLTGVKGRGGVITLKCTGGVARIKGGDSTVTATASDYPLTEGFAEEFWVDPQGAITHVAFYSASGTVVVSCAETSPKV